jgi:hypothetical protein
MMGSRPGGPRVAFLWLSRKRSLGPGLGNPQRQRTFCAKLGVFYCLGNLAILPQAALGCAMPMSSRLESKSPSEMELQLGRSGTLESSDQSSG